MFFVIAEAVFFTAVELQLLNEIYASEYYFLTGQDKKAETNPSHKAMGYLLFPLLLFLNSIVS